LQQYITPPLLLNGRKFHIRAYVLCVDALRVYLCKDSLALCAGSRYKENDTSNLLSHITNTCYQQVDPNFDEDSCVLLWNINNSCNDDDKNNVASILVQNGTCTELSVARQRIQKVNKDMERITAELFAAFENEFAVFQPIPGCFEHYGLDFIIDASWNVYLLEVNPGPDFKQTGTRLHSVIQDLMSATIDVALVPQRHDDVDDNDLSAAAGGCYCPDNLSLVYNKKTSMAARGSQSIMNMKLS
jgi:tubulin---tyrosine ligase